MNVASVDVDPMTAQRIPPGKQTIHFDAFGTFVVRYRRTLKSGDVRLYLQAPKRERGFLSDSEAQV